MEEILQECMMKATAAGVQWRDTQDSLQKLESSNVEAVGSIIKSGTEANQLLLANFTQASTSTNEAVKTGNDNLLSSIDSSLKLDHDVCINIHSIITPCANEFIELQRSHYGKVVETTNQAEKYLQEEYMEDLPSCTTPRRRPISLPSMGSIEQLRTPPFDELLQTFRDIKLENRLKQGNGEIKHLIVSEISPMRDSRIPLIAKN
jgi:kinesin family protein 11